MTTADPPRLVLRFAVCTCVALALAAGAVLMIVRHLVTVQAEHAAATQARVIADSALRGSLTEADFRAPVTASRRAQLDQLFRTKVLAEGFLLVELYARDGAVTYSTDHRLVGRTPTGQLVHIREALTGTVTGRGSRSARTHPSQSPAARAPSGCSRTTRRSRTRPRRRSCRRPASSRRRCCCCSSH